MRSNEEPVPPVTTANTAVVSKLEGCVPTGYRASTRGSQQEKIKIKISRVYRVNNNNSRTVVIVILRMVDLLPYDRKFPEEINTGPKGG